MINSGANCAELMARANERIRVLMDQNARVLALNAELAEAAYAVLSNEEHAFSGGMRKYQIGSHTWEVYQALRDAADKVAATKKERDDV